LIEAVKLWNEPNNKSHWDFEIDSDWKMFARMASLAGEAVRGENGSLTRVLGGISPIDAKFVLNMKEQGVLDRVDAIAVHGFPLDWNHWQIHEWPERLAEIQALTDLRRTAELLLGRAPRIHWYSLYDLPRAWPATTRHREAEGSSYYRHFYLGLLREDGTPKLALKHFSDFTPEMGICQWFHFEDHRLDDAVRWLRQLGVRKLRTGLSWADSFRPGADAWFDRQMQALDEFDVTITYCFTPEHRGIQPHHTSPPQCLEEYADFCARMTRRYA
jgi:beta-xylosidase